MAQPAQAGNSSDSLPEGCDHPAHQDGDAGCTFWIFHQEVAQKIASHITQSMKGYADILQRHASKNPATEEEMLEMYAHLGNEGNIRRAMRGYANMQDMFVNGTALSVEKMREEIVQELQPVSNANQAIWEFHQTSVASDSQPKTRPSRPKDRLERYGSTEDEFGDYFLRRIIPILPSFPVASYQTKFLAFSLSLVKKPNT